MAEKMDFTIRAIEALPAPAERRSEFKDTKAPGLYLRVTTKGVKTFSFVGRAKGASRVERLTLGKFPTVKPEQARQRATQIAGQLAAGTSVAAAARERRGELTLNQLKDAYLTHLRRTTKRPEHFEKHYDLYISPHFGARRLSEIRATDVARWHHALPEQILRRREAAEAERRAKKEQRRREVAARQSVRRHGPDPKPKVEVHLSAGRVTGKTTANRALDWLRAMFNWALRPQYALFSGVNPAAGHTEFPEVQRDRFLQPSEIRPFFEALATEPNATARDFVLTELLTGARRSNVQEMRWSELDFDRAEWRIPRTKNDDPQTVPLVEELVVLLQERKKTTNSVFVFASTKSKTGHIVNTAKSWKRLLQRAGLSDIRQHDLRRTLGSWQARTGASLVLIGKSLNHRDPSSTQIYARLDMDPVRESVTRATTAIFQAAGLKPPGEVIQLPVKAVRKSARKSARK